MTALKHKQLNAIWKWENELCKIKAADRAEKTETAANKEPGKTQYLADVNEMHGPEISLRLLDVHFNSKLKLATATSNHIFNIPASKKPKKWTMELFWGAWLQNAL